MELQGLAHGDLAEDVHVGVLDPHREEGEVLPRLALPHPRGGLAPLVGGGSVGDEEDPGAIERDAVLAVRLLAVLDQVQGVQVSAPFGNVKYAIEVLTALK